MESKDIWRREALGGSTTFLAMMYIIVVNPAILSQAGMSFSGVLTATVLVSALSSMAMGLYAGNPIALAPGMGLNAFFTYSVVQGMGVPWQVALGAVFWSGIVFFLLSIFNLRTLIVRAIPKQIRYGVSVGIGLFIALIGLMNANFIVDHPATLIAQGPMTLLTFIFIAGLLVSAILVIKEVPGALMLGIVLTTLLSIPIGRFVGDASEVNRGVATLVTWQGLFAPPDFSLIFALDFLEALKPTLWPVIFAFVFTDMFDSLSTFVGVAEAADLLDEDGEPLQVKESLVVDGLSTTISGLLGTSPGTAYIESATGIQAGGRTGKTAIVTGLCFLPFMFCSPLLSMVPALATAPALVLVGVYMMKPVVKIHWQNLDDAIPAFLAMFLIPATYSITKGIVWGFLSWTVIKLVLGKKEEVTPTLILIDCLAIGSFLV